VQKKDELRQFGSSLHAMRKRKHMTQMQLADALDVDYRSISRYENGEVEMGAMLYDKMLSVLGQKPGTQETQVFLQQFVSLTPENKTQVMNFVTALHIVQNQAV